jgi:hypothetical protein
MGGVSVMDRDEHCGAEDRADLAGGVGHETLETIGFRDGTPIGFWAASV